MKQYNNQKAVSFHSLPQGRGSHSTFIIEILKTYDDGVTFIEALKLAEGRHLLSNLDADMILQDEERYKKYSKLFYCWTGDLLVYEEPGKEFGEWECVAIYMDWRQLKKP